MYLKTRDGIPTRMLPCTRCPRGGRRMRSLPLAPRGECPSAFPCQCPRPRWVSFFYFLPVDLQVRQDEYALRIHPLHAAVASFSPSSPASIAWCCNGMFVEVSTVSEKMQRRIRVEGRVQGVYFRVRTAESVRGLGVAGYVRNLPDGSVEIVVQGSPAAIDAVVAWAERGPPAARVDRVEVTESNECLADDSFSIRYR